MSIFGLICTYTFIIKNHQFFSIVKTKTSKHTLVNNIHSPEHIHSPIIMQYLGQRRQRPSLIEFLYASTQLTTAFAGICIARVQNGILYERRQTDGSPEPLINCHFNYSPGFGRFRRGRPGCSLSSFEGAVFRWFFVGCLLSSLRRLS